MGKQNTIVEEVMSGGLVSEWNAKNDGRITQGASVMDINGTRGPAIHPVMRQGGKLTLQIQLAPEMVEQIQAAAAAEAAKAQREKKSNAKKRRRRHAVKPNR